MKMKQFHAALPVFGPEKCPVYLRLQWLGSVSTRFEKQVKSAVKTCFFAVELRVVCSTNKLLCATNKDVLHAIQKSNMIYQFSCHCDSQYVGRTSKGCRTESNNMSQIYPFLLFFPKTLTSCSSVKIFHPDYTHSLASDSAIKLHLLQNTTCAQHYDDSRLSILAQGHSPFHLSALEANVIKTSNFALCQQKNSCTA